MLGDLRILVRLKARHLRSEAVWWCYLAHTDVLEDKSLGDRLYQAYIGAIAATCVLLAWTALLSAAPRFFAGVDPAIAGMLPSLLALLACAVFAVAFAAYLIAPPLRLKPPDIAFVAASPLSLRLFALLDVAVSAAAAATAAFLAAFLAASGLQGATAAAVPVGAVAFAAAACVALPLLLAAGSAFALRQGRKPREALIDAAAANAQLNSLGRLSWMDPGLYRRLRQRARVARRKPRLHLPACSGARMVLARAVLSHARQFEGIAGIAAWGAFAASASWLMVSVHEVPFLLCALLGAVALLEHARSLTRVFQDDCRVRLVRDRLAFGTLQLLMLDSLPALALAALASAAVAAALPLPPDELAWCLSTSLLLDATAVLCGGLDAVPARGRWKPSFELELVFILMLAGSLSLAASPALLVAVLLASALALAALLRSAR